MAKMHFLISVGEGFLKVGVSVCLEMFPVLKRSNIFHLPRPRFFPQETTFLSRLSYIALGLLVRKAFWWIKGYSGHWVRQILQLLRSA